MILYKTNTVSLSYHVCSVLCDALTDANDGQLWMMMNDWCPWCSNIFIALNRFHLQSSSFITLKKIVAQLIFRARFMPSQSMNKKKNLPQHSTAQVLFCFAFDVSVNDVWITKQPQTLTRFKKQYQEVKEESFWRWCRKQGWQNFQPYFAYKSGGLYFHAH